MDVFLCVCVCFWDGTGPAGSWWRHNEVSGEEWSGSEWQLEWVSWFWLGLSLHCCYIRNNSVFASASQHGVYFMLILIFFFFLIVKMTSWIILSGPLMHTFTLLLLLLTQRNECLDGTGNGLILPGHRLQRALVVCGNLFPCRCVFPLPQTSSASDQTHWPLKVTLHCLSDFKE